MSIQGSPEWHAERLGRATASRFADVMAKIKTGEAAGRRNYRAQLVCERLTGTPSESFTTAAMQFGTEQEPFARAAYEAQFGELVEQVGFIQHSDLMAGCSPDGLLGDDGGLEIKVPNTATHIDTILNGFPVEHTPQIQGAMWITGRKWWDFVSFDPRMPERLQLYAFRVMRDEKLISEIEAEVRRFLNEVDETVARLMEKAA